MWLIKILLGALACYRGSQGLNKCSTITTYTIDRVIIVKVDTCRNKDLSDSNCFLDEHDWNAMSVQFVAFICLPALAQSLQVFNYLHCHAHNLCCPNKGNRAAAGIWHCLGVQPTQLAATRFGVRPLEQSCHSLKKGGVAGLGFLS